MLRLIQSNPPLHSAELGIVDFALTWFTSYLTNRIFQVTRNDSLSKPCFLETGVPQGSVVGLVLFSLYTRSLGSAVTSHGFSDLCYADNTKLLLSVPLILRHPRCNATSLFGQMHITSHSTFIKLNIKFFILGKDCPLMDLSVTVADVTVSLT